MKLFKFALVLVLCIVTEGIQEAIPDKADPSFPVGPTLPTNGSSSTTKPPKPTTTTAAPVPTTSATTTAAPPTTSTAKPKPTTTTAAPTTSKTTPEPTTTARPIPTTPAPNPNQPDVGSWNVTKPGTNITCILSKMALQIEVDYEDKNQTKKAVLNVPANATANGTCDNGKTNQLAIMWTDGQNATNYVTFNFLNNTNTSEVSLDNILVTINGLHAPNETGPMNFLYNSTVFSTPLQHSYKCNKEQTLALINPKNDTKCKAMLKVSHLQMEAFRTSTTADFENPIDCIRSTPDIVPIAVGCALAALVVIVLLAYLYGRKRSQARGYLSM